VKPGVKYCITFKSESSILSIASYQAKKAMAVDSLCPRNNNTLIPTIPNKARIAGLARSAKVTTIFFRKKKQPGAKSGTPPMANLKRDREYRIDTSVSHQISAGNESGAPKKSACERPKHADAAGVLVSLGKAHLSFFFLLVMSLKEASASFSPLTTKLASTFISDGFSKSSQMKRMV